MGQKNKVPEILKWVLISFFCLCIAAEIYSIFAASGNWHWLSAKRVFILLFLSYIFLCKSKTTWIMAMALFVYGMLSCMFSGLHGSLRNPTTMEFTANLFHFINPIGSISKRLTDAVPLIFYFFSFLCFATPTVRKWYGFSGFKGKSQASYLK
ncbi:MAG: hypothetical protein REI78_12900 [Pedobacter sp.]|nr:hypothetical protein [Pedobacter sp.]MDQ8053925.1 hypothetical protein [Pedobacter sp.]